MMSMKKTRIETLLILLEKEFSFAEVYEKSVEQARSSKSNANAQGYHILHDSQP